LLIAHYLYSSLLKELAAALKSQRADDIDRVLEQLTRQTQNEQNEKKVPDTD